MNEQENIGPESSSKLKNGGEKFAVEKSRSKSFRRMAQIKFHAPEKNPQSEELQPKSSKSGTIFFSNKEPKQLEQAKSEKSQDESNGNESKQNDDEDLARNKTELHAKQPSSIQQHVSIEGPTEGRFDIKNTNFQQIFANVKKNDFFIRSFGSRVVKMVRSSGGKIFGLKQVDSDLEKKLQKVSSLINSLKRPRDVDPNEFVLNDDQTNDWIQPNWITPDPEAKILQKFLSWSHQQQSAILLMDDKILSKTMNLNYQREIFVSQYSGTAFFLAKYEGRTCLVKRINFERKYFDSDTDWVNIIKLVCQDYRTGEVRGSKPFARVHEVFNWPSKSQLFIFMEILTNKTLHYRIKQRQPLNVNQVRLWTAQLLNGISFLQNLAIIHRNLRLEHLALDADDNLKIIGWRRATTFFKPLGTTHSNLVSKREKRLRKNNHLPPEAFHHNHDPRSIDVWSYGVVLCSLATFRYPFKVMDRKICLDVEQAWIEFQERHPYSFDRHPAIKTILDSIFIQEPMRRANISDLQCSEFYQRPNKLASLQNRFIRLN